MNTEKKLLEVGDVVYWEYRNLPRRCTIDKVDGVLAYANKFPENPLRLWLHRELTEGCTSEVNGYAGEKYYIETKELKDRYERPLLFAKIKEHLKDCPVDQLREVCRILDIKTD